MGDYFYSISICGIVCGLIKRLAPVRYRDILNLLCSVMLISVILQPVSFNKEITYTPADNTDTLICKIYADELNNEINKLLSESAYNAKVDNIYCECKEGEIEIVKISYNGDISAGDYLSSVLGISRDKVIYSG